jgi:hypothetical protein
MFNQYFYHRLLRKYIVLFGSVFNNITVKRMNADFTEEIERLKVPVNWSAKEKYIQKIASTSETPLVQTVLPRMSFELIGLNYDASRKQQNLQRHATLNTSNNSVVWAAYSAAPYTLSFKLNIHTRSIEDLGQIIEQILPYFQPDYTPTANLLENLRMPKDIKIVMRSVDPQFGYEGELAESTRDIAASLLFDLNGYFWGPVTSEKVITKVIVNAYAESSGPVLINLGDGSGVFQHDEMVYQGNSTSFATASGQVVTFYNSNVAKQLLVDVRQGNFTVNTAIKSVDGNVSYMMDSFEVNTFPAITFTVTPSPLTANADSIFGIDIQMDSYDG